MEVEGGRDRARERPGEMLGGSWGKRGNARERRARAGKRGEKLGESADGSLARGVEML